MSTKVFVSPGVYTSEKDLTFITRQVGVTQLGLVGETTFGPAFQPIFIGNYGEFQSFFGGLNATKVKDTGAPQYELPYIAKSYLSQSNQLFVTRVLGLSGYDAGLAWGITLDANVDPSTTGITGSDTYSGTNTGNSLITFETSGSSLDLSSNDSLIQDLIDEGSLTEALASIATSNIGQVYSIGATYLKNGNDFEGVSFDYVVTSTGSTANGISGITSGVTTYYSGTSYTGIDDKLVALLRSRGKVNQATQAIDFEVDTDGGVSFDPAYSASTIDPLGDFALVGTSNTQGPFTNVVSLDRTKKNYILRVLGRDVQNGNTPLFVEEYFGAMFEELLAEEKIRGVKQTIVEYSNDYADYLQPYAPAVTPYVVSELRGTDIFKLFRFWTISDGNAANEQFKISFTNIKLDTREFDVIIRNYYDNDVSPVVLESFSRCTMNPNSNNFIGRRIGTLDGLYPSKSAYVLLELDDTADTSDAFPAGFLGFPIRDYQTNSNTDVLNPTLSYKVAYGAFENKRKSFLGLSDTVGIDSDFFDYKGIPETNDPNYWTGLTAGFHMDISANTATVNNVPVEFSTGDAQFRTEAGVAGGPYEKIYSRKFTVAPYGGYDGWDIYRTRRSNLDADIINGTNGINGLTSGSFKHIALTNGDTGINSDYYAYLEAIWTFRNPEAININVFATPGIDNFDNTNLIEETIEMIEQERADSLYIMTTPDTNLAGDAMSVEDVTDFLDGMYDSNYSCTYWPWVQINDTENNVYIFVPPTRDVVRNIALTDNIAFPWFAVAGIQRGDVDAVQARKKLTLAERDNLYENRINPIATFTSDGIKIWGNKTLQVRESALNRINVRRLLLQARKLISAVSIRLLFEQNDNVVRNQFLSIVTPILDNIRSERGLYDFRVVLSNDPEDFDKNQLTGQIFLKPTRALEFIQLEFVIMNTGASFDNV
jgi:hypothetical protein